MQPVPKFGPAATLQQPDTSITQKMLSAVSGSVLTSLLGMQQKSQDRAFSESTGLTIVQSPLSTSSAYGYRPSQVRSPPPPPPAYPPSSNCLPTSA